MQILLSTNPPYAQMIVDEYKFIDFRNTAPKDNIIKNIVLSSDELGNVVGTIKVYIYETKNLGGCGKIIGEAELLQIHKLKYKSLKDYAVGPKLIKARENFLRELYDSYCFVKHIVPKPHLKTLTKFEENQFRKYQREIGFNADVDYAWEVTNIIKYEEPKDLKDFGITRAPYNWCYINR